MFDPVRLTVAIVPLALYALWLGRINLKQRPTVLSGPADLSILAFGLGGFLIIGPFELLAPDDAFRAFGYYIWIMLAILYSLLVSLTVLVMRPSIVIYNLSWEEFRPRLLQTLQDLKVESRWVGSMVVLPELGIEMHLENFGWLRNLRLVSVGDEQSLHGWRVLHLALLEQLRDCRVVSHQRGLVFVLSGLALIVGLTLGLVVDHQQIASALNALFPSH